MTETTKQTSGPWSISGIAGDHYVMARDGHNKFAVAICGGHPFMSPEELEANKQLIASVPDLLALCKWALILCNALGREKSTICFDGGAEFCLTDELRNGITKATQSTTGAHT